MRPIVIVFLIFVGIGVVYFLATSQSETITGALDTIQSKAGLSGHQLTGIVKAVVVFAVLYFLYNWMRSSMMRRQADKRFRDEINQPPEARNRR